MPESLKIDVNGGERVAIVGMTGTGKTVFAQELLRGVDRLVVVDAKGTLGKWGLEAWSTDAIKRLEDGEPVRARAVLDPGEDGERFWASVLQRAWYARNCFVYVDEAYLITDEGKTVTKWLRAIWTTGRELGVSGVVASQRPRWIPRFLLSESEHVVMFGLRLPEDREYVAELIGAQARHLHTGEGVSTEEWPPNKHGFFYAAIGKGGGAPIYVPKLPRGSALERGETVDLEVEDDD